MDKTDCLPWQTIQWQRLDESWSRQSLPHALLLTGIKGLGKAQFAKALASAILCHSDSSSLIACGQCASCQLLAADTHSDLMILEPEGKSQQIKIDSVRAVTEFTQLTAQQSHYQVIIIEQADRMNITAANALLKTLEEPPKETVLILISDEPAKLLATIKSRCQSVTFTAPERAVAISWLANNEVAADSAGALLNLSADAPLQALALSEAQELDYQKQWLSAFYQLSLRKMQLLAFVKQFLAEGVQKQLRYLSLFFSDLVRYKMTEDTSALLMQHSQNNLQAIAQRCQSQQVFLLLDKVNEAASNVQRISGLNPELLLESILINWMRATQ